MGETGVITNEELIIENGIAAPEIKNFILKKKGKISKRFNQLLRK